MREDGKIDYVELPGGDLIATKRFYEAAFGWGFTDYGPSYSAFDEGLDGGFDGDAANQPDRPLVVLYTHDLERMAAKGQEAGGAIVKPIFSFPGGRRFHFRDHQATSWRSGRNASGRGLSPNRHAIPLPSGDGRRG